MHVFRKLSLLVLFWGLLSCIADSAHAGSCSENCSAVSITKTASPATFVVGQPAEYDIVVSNTGTGVNLPASGITVTDTLPMGITLVSASGAGWSCSGTPLVCTYPGIPIGGVSSTLVLSVAIARGTVDASNSAIVNASSSNDINCPAGANAPTCTGSVAVPVITPTSAVSITKAASPGTFVVGQPAEYEIVVSNTGTAANSAASGITVTDLLPAGVTLVSASGKGWSCSGVPLVCTYPSIAVGQSSTSLFLNVAIAAGTTQANNSAVVNVTGGNDANCPSGASGPACTGSVAVPVITLTSAVSITKVASPATFVAGQPAEYDIAVSNTGAAANTPATAITVTDVLPPGVTLVSANGQGWSCSGSPLVCTYPAVPVGQATSTLKLSVTIAPGTTQANNSATVNVGGNNDANCPTGASGPACTASVQVPVRQPVTQTLVSAPANAGWMFFLMATSIFATAAICLRRKTRAEG